MTPCSPLSCARRFGGTYGLRLQAACHLLARWFAELISSNLKMEAISSSETSGATQRTIRRHIPEDDALHNHRCENLKSYIVFLCGEPTRFFLWNPENFQIPNTESYTEPVKCCLHFALFFQSQFQIYSLIYA
jgi:hypothetical protein